MPTPSDSIALRFARRLLVPDILLLFLELAVVFVPLVVFFELDPLQRVLLPRLLAVVFPLALVAWLAITRLWRVALVARLPPPPRRRDARRDDARRGVRRPARLSAPRARAARRALVRRRHHGRARAQPPRRLPARRRLHRHRRRHRARVRHRHLPRAGLRAHPRAHARGAPARSRHAARLRRLLSRAAALGGVRHRRLRHLRHRRVHLLLHPDQPRAVRPPRDLLPAHRRGAHRRLVRATCARCRGRSIATSTPRSRRAPPISRCATIRARSPPIARRSRSRTSSRSPRSPSGSSPSWRSSCRASCSSAWTWRTRRSCAAPPSSSPSAPRSTRRCGTARRCARCSSTSPRATARRRRRSARRCRCARKMLAGFGALTFFACGMSLFLSYMQYKTMASGFIQRESELRLDSTLAELRERGASHPPTHEEILRVLRDRGALEGAEGQRAGRGGHLLSAARRRRAADRRSAAARQGPPPLAVDRRGAHAPARARRHAARRQLAHRRLRAPLRRRARLRLDRAAAARLSRPRPRSGAAGEDPHLLLLRAADRVDGPGHPRRRRSDAADPRSRAPRRRHGQGRSRSAR